MLAQSNVSTRRTFSLDTRCGRRDQAQIDVPDPCLTATRRSSEVVISEIKAHSQLRTPWRIGARHLGKVRAALDVIHIGAIGVIQDVERRD
jgi:hypothetical protein